ncbi:SDR family oxidoreductase [uncultured Sneathiella sp.]|mgnify:FL=1|jgi:NAD(P)-dependent dehydrogenase (short-subunit alcohol dehydrogenase family)|uniref:SDR family NAD(P)-dependent oxidoreductase n=2 Tax=uncultured Sneathiella sp. TaxID=879315 RepID=UPI0030D9E6FC|tara:strand:+ start:21096 stop:21866 length:771 start_codon:yes stop_codon:yes gene_type:complete
MFDLSGKTAVITGSSKGIGKAIAHQMALAGAKVTISSRKADICEEVAAEINASLPEGSSGKAVSVPCNINSKESLRNLVDETHKVFGDIHILVCNAALNPYFGPSTDIPDDAFDKIMSANIKSNHWLCNMVLPEMKMRKDGAIIIVSSIGGIRGSAVLGAYSISKAADMQLVRNLAVEHGADNIRVNAIAPGLIQTEFARALWENPDILKKATSRAPLQRIGQPDEIAGAAVYMASDAGTFLTGQTLVIDGGQTIT